MVDRLDRKRTTEHIAQSPEYPEPMDLAYGKARHDIAMDHDHLDSVGDHLFYNQEMKVRAELY